MARKRRQRRTAEEAREQILDAAAEAMAKAGPGGIRLKSIADTVGIRHPTILHHFGSREGLVMAVGERAMDALSQDLMEAITAAATGTAPLDAMEEVFRVFGDQGYARQLAWLALSGHFGEALAKPYIERIADVLHPLRVAALEAQGRIAPDLTDTRFVIVLSAMSLFGAAIVGDVMLESAGLSRDEAIQKRFRAWVHQVMMGHLEGDGEMREMER